LVALAACLLLASLAIVVRLAVACLGSISISVLRFVLSNSTYSTFNFLWPPGRQGFSRLEMKIRPWWRLNLSVEFKNPVSHGFVSHDDFNVLLY
jgi:hypothetical protein